MTIPRPQITVTPNPHEPPYETAGDPGAAIERATARVLELARTWLAWDGRP